MPFSAATLILAIVVLVAVALLATRLVVGELRRSQALAVAPRLVLDIAADDDTIAVVTITNVGAGPAFDAALSVELRRRPRELGDDASPLPHRFHTARVLRPGDQVRFPPPGDPSTGYLTPVDLSAEVRSIHLTGTATDLRGEPFEVVDHLTDPFLRLHRVLGSAAHRPAPAALHAGRSR
jgi:hypothetical protein